MLEEMVEYDYFIHFLTMGVVALLHMFLHLCGDAKSLLLNQVYVFLLVHHILLATQFVLYLLEGVCGQHAKFLLDLLLD